MKKDDNGNRICCHWNKQKNSKTKQKKTKKRRENFFFSFVFFYRGFTVTGKSRTEIVSEFVVFFVHFFSFFFWFEVWAFCFLCAQHLNHTQKNWWNRKKKQFDLSCVSPFWFDKVLFLCAQHLKLSHKQNKKHKKLMKIALLFFFMFVFWQRVCCLRCNSSSDRRDFSQTLLFLFFEKNVPLSFLCFVRSLSLLFLCISLWFEKKKPKLFCILIFFFFFVFVFLFFF